MNWKTPILLRWTFPEDLEAHIKLATAFGEEIISAFRVNDSEGGELSTDILLTFRPHSS